MSTNKAQLLADLDALDALFSDEGKWAKGWFAYTANGTPVNSRSVNAVQWCLIGGCIRVSNSIDIDESGDEIDALESALAETFGSERSLALFNDDSARTFADIKSLIASTRTRIAGQTE